jgi:hypothetical protein
LNQSTDPSLEDYPHGRGYGHDYMRGGEVLGGYGYAERKDYEKRRGDNESVETTADERKQSQH